MRVKPLLPSLLAMSVATCSDPAQPGPQTLPTAVPMPFFSTANWSGPVGQLYDANGAMVGTLISPTPWEGHYEVGWHSSSGNIRRGVCLAGSQPGPDGPTKLRCLMWTASRTTAPSGFFQCALADCSWAFRDATGKLYGAEEVRLEFIIETPVGVTVAGPQTPITSSGTYTWTANPSGGDGSTYAYWWGYSLDNVSWNQVASTRSYSRSLAAGDPSFYLKVIVASLSTQKTIVQSVAVNITVPPLSVTISGPNTISTKGTYTWTATPSGGVGGYSYAWELIQGGSRVGLENQSTQSMTVYGGDPDFYMKVTVTSGGSTVADSVFVRNCIGLGGGCGA